MRHQSLDPLRHLLVLIVLWAKTASSSSLQVTDDYFINLYNPNLVSDSSSVRVNYAERIKNATQNILTLGQLAQELTASRALYARSIDVSGHSALFANEPNATLIDLLFSPFDDYNSPRRLREMLDDARVEPDKFKLESLNLTGNGLSEHFLTGYALSVNNPKTPTTQVNSTLFQVLLYEYFSQVKLLKLSFNKLRHLKPEHFEMFYNQQLNESSLEAVLLDSNELRSIQHDTFHLLANLKFVDLSRNKLKLIHPLTFQLARFPKLFYVDASHNNLVAVFNFQTTTDNTGNQVASSSVSNSLKYFYLNENDDIRCDCGLVWLFKLKDRVDAGRHFRCLKSTWTTSDNNGESGEVYKSEVIVDFDQLSETELRGQCNGGSPPDLIVNTDKFEKISDIPVLRRLSKAWFAHNVFEDNLPVTTPAPYLTSEQLNENENSTVRGGENENANNMIVFEPKRKFFAWVLDDAVFECNTNDTTKSAVLWKTQYGYLSNMDPRLMRSLADDEAARALYTFNNNTASYKIFYTMNGLTRVYKNFTVRVSHRFASGTRSLFYVNERNQLVVTNMRHVVAGPFSCMAVDERGMRVYEYEIHVRSGVGESFVISLIVSLVSMIVPSIVGLMVCCYCEWEADVNYPMTPPNYPTPMAETPPNFDFNEWLQNAGSYLPHLNIHDTLEQVSKRLRKGVEKAGVTVRSLGLTSGAYIVSVYEHGSQRFNDMNLKSYVPTMPTVTSINKYGPGQLATRVRSGMGNMIIQFREFCGTNDAAHTVSMHNIVKIVDLGEGGVIGSDAVAGTIGGANEMVNPMVSGESGSAAAAAVAVNHTYYQKFLQMIREEHQKRALKSKKTPTHFLRTSGKINEEDEYESCVEDDFDEEDDDDSDSDGRRPRIRPPVPRTFTTTTCVVGENAPTTSAYASAANTSSSSSSSASSSSTPSGSSSIPQPPLADLPKVVLTVAAETAKPSDSNVEEKEVAAVLAAVVRDVEAVAMPTVVVHRKISLADAENNEHEVKTETTTV